MPSIPFDDANYSDEALVALAKNGNDAAANELVRRMYSLVYFAAESFYHNGMEKADLIQEGMIGLIRAIRTYDPQNSTRFKTYAKSCVTHHLSSTIRRLNQKKQIPQDKLISINKFSLQSTVSGPEELMIARERYAAIMNTLHTELSEFEFEIFKKYLSGYSAAEIADLLGIHVKRVSNALYRIRQKFHSILK